MNLKQKILPVLSFLLILCVNGILFAYSDTDTDTEESFTDTESEAAAIDTFDADMPPALLDDETFAEYETVVRAKEDNSSFVQTTIDEREIRSKLSTPSIDGLLENSAGVDLNRWAAGGSQNSRLKLRGMAESRLLVLLGGRKLNGAGVYGGYYVDWASLTVESVERLELPRGAAPVKYGNNLGGVLNIVTREGTKDPHGFLRMAGGRYGTWDAQLSSSWGIGPVLFNVYAGHHTTEGYLRNAFVENDSVGGKLTFLLPNKFRLSTAARYSYNNSGLVVYNMPDSPYYDKSLPDSLETQMSGPWLLFANHNDNNRGPLDWGEGSDLRDHLGQFDEELSRKTDAFDVAVGAWLTEQVRKDRFYAIEDPRYLVVARESRAEKHNWGWQLDLKNTLYTDFEINVDNITFL